MAKSERDLNLGNDDESVDSEDSEDQQKEKGGMKKIIIIVVALLVVCGGAAAFFLMGGDSSEPAADDAEEVVEEVVEEDDDDEEEKEPIYQALVKDFVVTFGEGEEIRYLQLSLEVMSFDQEVIDKVETNLPSVRNSLILLIGGQSYDDLKTNEGKEKLRKEIIGVVRKAARLKKKQKLEDAFYTGFVLQ